MNPPPGDAARILLQALVRLSRERDDVRQALEVVRDWLAGVLPPGEGQATGQGATPGSRSGSRPSSRPGGPPVLLDKVLTPPGDRRTAGARGPGAGRLPSELHSEPHREPHREPRRVDLTVVVRRARWKAAATRFAADRRRALAAESGLEAIRRREEELRRQREQLEDCYAWMLDTPRTLPSDDLLVDVADSYDALALAAEVTLELERRGALMPSPLSGLLYLLAEAQSALLAALNKCDQRGDSDQRDLFLWLKDQTTRHRIYVDRYMRLDDPADSKGSEDLSRRLRELFEEAKQRHRKRQARGQLLNKVRYHAGKAADGGEATDHDWSSVAAAVDSWLEHGLPATDRAFVDVVREFVSAHGEGRESTPMIDRLLGHGLLGHGAPSEETSGAPQSKPPAVEQAVELIGGKRLLVFGDADCADAGEPIRDALQLAELRWIEVPAEDPLACIAEQVAQPDVDLVLIATRLPPEIYAEFKDLCMRSGRPFVRLPGGLDPPQVAHQILRQVGWRLRERARA